MQSLSLLQPLNKKIARGWQVVNVSSISSGLPFTVYSGIQQTGVGSAGLDRPDQAARPQLSTARPRREDCFGRGDGNASFSLPTTLREGGPNQGFETLGLNSFPRAGLS